MFIFFQKVPLWLIPFYLIIPFSLFLAAKGIEAVVRGKSMTATYFVAATLFISLGIAAFFVVFLNSQMPNWLLNFSLPFGAIAFFTFDEFPENLVLVRAFVFVLGVFCNACAIGCLIEFAERMFRLNREINKLDD